MPLSPIKTLLIEDHVDDVDLIQRALGNFPQGIEFVNVSDERSLRNALDWFSPEIVLSDFSMPGFDGFGALEIVKQHSVDIPFIFVSGTIGEERAIDALRQGAADYVLKDNLKRLVPAMERALHDSIDRQNRRRMAIALHESEQRYRSLIDNTQDWVWEIDAVGHYVYSSPGVEQILGYRSDDLLGHDGYEYWPENERDILRQTFTEHLRVSQGWRNWLIRWRHHDGSWRFLESNAHPLFDELGKPRGFRGIDRNATERIAQERRLRQLSRLHVVLSALGSIVLTSSRPEDILQKICNLAVEQGEFVFAGVIADISGDPPYAIVHHQGDVALYEYTKDYLAAAPGVDLRSLRISLQNKHVVLLAGTQEIRKLISGIGQVLALENASSRSLIALPFGEDPIGVLLLHSTENHTFDFDEVALLERLAAEITHSLDFIARKDELAYIAHHSELTLLPNRTVFREQLRDFQLGGSTCIALIGVMELYRFYDSHGHAFSVALLRGIAQRLQLLIRPGELLAHLSESTFALVLECGTGIDGAVGRLESLVGKCTNEPYVIEENIVSILLHCGLVETRDQNLDADMIERNAHSALTEARRRRKRVVVYSEEFSQRAKRRLQLDRELRVGLEEGQFELFYQPKFSARTLALTSAEALLRWRHPQRGMVLPSEFIPALEENGLILSIGQWIMRVAIETVQRWRHLGHPKARLAVNVSARELLGGSFVADTERLLLPYGDDHGLDIELTEGLLMEDMDRCIGILGKLRKLGCEIHIDDFGTGYSSLNYLSRLPVDVLKIDRSFVSRIAEEPESHALVSNIINLAHSLRLRVVAEGVEDVEQAKLLRLLHCDELQGYYFGKPCSLDDFFKNLDSRLH